MSDAPAQYLSVRNLRIVLAQTVIVALGAIGMTMIIVSGGIDLSVGSTIALTSVVTAVLLRDGCSPIDGGRGRRRSMGGLVGVVNGLAITRAAGAAVHRHARHARRRARRRQVAGRSADGQRAGRRGSTSWRSRSRRRRGCSSRPACGSRWCSRSSMTVVLRAHGVRPARLRHRLERGGGARLRRRHRPPQGRDLRPGRPVLRPVRRDADVAPAPGRSDRRHRHRARHHRRRRHRRRQPAPAARARSSAPWSAR